MLATEPGIEVVGEAGDGAAALEQARRLQPDVILMDLEMPDTGGIEAIRQIRAADLPARILVVTSFATDDKVRPAIKAGALGYLLKDATPEELVRAIRQSYRGEGAPHPAIARKVIEEISRPPRPAQSIDLLTERELEVLRLVARGMSNQEIADSLVISEATVRTHVSSILAKLQLTSRTQAALYAVQAGIVSFPEPPRT